MSEEISNRRGRLDSPLLFLIAFAALVGVIGDHGFVLPDEAWFIRVVQRVLQGGHLYRDVYFGATPLSVAIAMPLAWAFGPELAVGRLLSSATFVASGALGLRLIESVPVLGSGRRWMFVLALATYGRPSGLTALYSGVSYLFLLACLAVALGEPGRRRAWLGGVCAGLAFSSKQTIGAYALLALLSILITDPNDWRSRLRDAITAAASFGAVVLIVVLPAVEFSGLWAFLECTVENKAGYVRLGMIPYWKGIRDWFELLITYRTSSIGVMSNLYWRLVFFVPLFSLLCTVGIAIVSEKNRRRCAIASAFLGAACLGLYPIGDEAHCLLVTPLALVSLAICLPLERFFQQHRAVVAILLTALSIGPSYCLVNTLARYWAGSEKFCSLPPFRGLLVRSAQVSEFRDGIEVISRAASVNRDILVLSSRAAIYYLATSARNPTPYDYPLENVFSKAARRRVLSALDDGTIRSVAIDNASFSHSYLLALKPQWIDQAARAKLSCSAVPANWDLCSSGVRK